MYDNRAADLADSALATKTGTFATVVEYTDEHPTTPTTASRLRSRGNSISRDFQTNRSPQRLKPALKMAATGYAVSPEPAPALFVRAMYDYDADDHTSLSFRRGDIIQVLNQLETGWWDGVIDNIRGWFPSNYCQIVTEADDFGEHLVLQGHDDAEISAGSGLEDEYGDGQEEDELDSAGNPRDSHPILPIEGIPQPKEQEEAAFWIPQATPDGRLFYFNTLTGYSTMELPFENPTATNENGPWDRNNFFVHLRPR
jgi:son of sevenless-like protein